MTTSDYLNVIIYIVALFSLSPFLGSYIATVLDKNYDGKLEAMIYKILHIDTSEQNAKDYLKTLLIFHIAGFILFFIVIKNPFGARESMSWHLAFNTAISFITNTNWQAYSGEVSLSPLAQMLGPTVQNFLSAASGIAVMAALVRGLRNRETPLLGNFWRDITRSIIYILLPLSLLLSVVLIASGVVQTLKDHTVVETLEAKTASVLPLGPVASQVAIKQLGTNGGGFFGVNSAHPYENPTPFSNFCQSLSILLIPCALIFTFGFMLKRRKQAVVIFSVVTLFWLLGLGVSLYGEHQVNPALESHHFIEGKEIRFSRTEAVIWATATTAASNGSVNAMHSSLSPLSGLVALFNMMTGEIIYGGVGSGMYGMILFVILTVFLSGLMVGRTPEYLQKKIDAFDMKWTIIALIVPICTILLGSAISIHLETGLASRSNFGPHGLSEILYAWTSAGGNNGSAFAGLNANTAFYNILLGIAMLLGRFGVIIPALLIAGNFSQKKLMQDCPNQMCTDSLTFGCMLFSVILIVGALTFFPALLLGPIVEHLLMMMARCF
ncbi:MAG: potassium-transporting ATPase subunit KdpA [Oligoflexia bacterium]|nr:potassium-transporting ATPase subunit KdpA [Oligoflexia bacterium]MBF0367267.1 potassium-transporting ATPase subunit KdpA [Oligoflexia bacterium]